VTEEKMNLKNIIGLTLLGLFAIGIVKFAPLELLFQDHLSDARASIAVSDIDGAIKSYKLAVMENVEDSQVRREYIDFMKEQGDLEEWLELEQTFLKAFPSVENFKSYDKSIYDLVLRVNDESARILSEGDIARYQSKRREQQELLKLFSPALLNLKAPSDYSLDYAPGPIFANIYHYDPNDAGEEKIIKAHLLIELNIAWVLLTRGDNSYFNFLRKDGNVDALVRDQYGFTRWAEPFLKVYLEAIALDASDILYEQGKASDAQDLLESCTKYSLEYMRNLYNRRGYFRESVFDSMKEVELIPDLYRECSYELTVLHMNKGKFDLADATIAALRKNHGEICETCDSLEDNSKYSLFGLSFRLKSFAQSFRTGASEAFDDKNWELASKLYLYEGYFHERYNPDHPRWSAENYYNAAIAYSNNEHFSKSLTLLAKIQEKYPSYETADITKNLASISQKQANYLFNKQFQQGQSAFDEKDYRQAIQHYRKAIDASPINTDVPAAIFNIGQAHFLLEQYIQAIDQFRRLSKEYPDYNPEKTQSRIAASSYEIGYKKYKAARDQADEAFDKKSWVVAAAKYAEAETLAAENGDLGVAAECAYNAAIAIMNNKKYSRAKAILRNIQSAYPTYEPTIVREQIKDIQSSCPNQFLGC
jgi:tetratricopeptide (TPR) repeat protein